MCCIVEKNNALTLKKHLNRKPLKLKRHKNVWPLIIDDGYSLYTFRHDNFLRKYFIEMVKHYYFE